MWTAHGDAQSVTRGEILASQMVPRRSYTSDPFDTSTDYGFFDAFGAAFLRENALIALVHELTDGDETTTQDLLNGRQSNFNPYSYLRENVDTETLARLAPFISDGDFENALSERVTQAIADDILYELSLQERMEGSFWGSLAGSFVTALVDPTSYVPGVNIASKARTLGTVSRIALNASLSAGLAEGFLQATQRNRTLEETIMNIGTAGALGGGIGLFASSLSRGSVLHPSHRDNPLREQNFRANGETVRSADGSQVDHISSEEIGMVREDLEADSVGAARVSGTEQLAPRLARRTPESMLGRASRRTGDFFNSMTIGGRAIRATSDTARMVSTRLIDVGGMLLDLHLQGKALKPSAEVLKKDFMAEVDGLFAAHRRNTIEVNQGLGKNGPLSRGKVDHADVMQLTQRRLVNIDDDDLVGRMVDKYGDEAFELMNIAANKNAELVHELNDVWEGRLLKEGILQDADRLSQIEAQFSEVAEAIDRGGFEGDELTTIRARRDELRRQLSQERRKAEPMGRDYGHAQLYNRDAILENPSAFKAWLMDALGARPNEQWLDENYDLSLKEFDDLQVSDRERFDEILRDWAGTEQYFRITQLENRLDAAKENLKQTELDLHEVLRAAKVARRDETALGIQEARARRDRLAANLETVRQRRAALVAEQQALREAAIAARSQTLDRRQAFDRVQQDDVPSTLSEQLDDFVNPTRRRDDPPEASTETATSTGRAQAVANQLAREDRRLVILEERLNRVNRTLDEVEALRAETTSMRRQLDDEVSAARKQAGIDAKSVARVKKALLRTRKGTGLEETVDDIYSSIMDTGRLPHAIIDRIIGESERVTGRVKDRVINLDPDQRAFGIQQGWLRDDLPEILYRQYDQLSAEFALREGVGIGDGRTFDSWDGVLRAVDEEYEQLIEASNYADLSAKLRREHRIMVDDIIEMRNRIKGSTDSDGTTFGWARWLSAKFRQVNYARYGGGFLLSSLTDVATVGLRHGGIAKLLSTHGRQAIDEMRQWYKGNPTEFQAFISSVEMGMGAAAAARRFGSEDVVHGAFSNHGVGFGRTRRITGSIDKAGERITEVVATYSGLPVWNRFWKTVSGIGMTYRLREMSARYGELSQAEVADLASLGIGRSEAERLHQMFQKYGSETDGRFDPGLERWGDEGESGIDAERDFRIAIQRDMDRAINTPGVGDTPRLMSTWYGKMWLQFQTFAFTFMNRFAYPAVQRASLFKERQAFMSFGLVLGAATTVMLGKDIINGRDPSARFEPENLTRTLHEIIDRSGLIGWTSPYVDSALKVTSPLTGYGGTSRYARNNALDGILGINAALFQDFGRAAGAIPSGDPNVANKLLVLAPFSTQTRLFYNTIVGE